MPTRAFAVEDGNIGLTTINTSRSKSYSDIDLTFTAKASGDIFKKSHAAAVKQAVKNLLLTNFSEKPFLPNFGGDLNAMLFRLSTEIDDAGLEKRISNAIESYEPRVQILNINTVVSPDNNDVRVTVSFLILSTLQQESVELNLTRLR